MNKIFKNTMTAVISSGLILSVVAPMAVEARPYSYTDTQAVSRRRARTRIRA